MGKENRSRRNFLKTAIVGAAGGVSPGTVVGGLDSGQTLALSNVVRSTSGRPSSTAITST